MVKNILIKNNMLSVKNKSHTMECKLKDISYFESRGRKIYIFDVKEFDSFYAKLDELSQILPDNYIRIHKSFIVNADKIKKIDKNILLLKTGQMLYVSRSHMAEVKKALKKANMCRESKESILFQISNYAYNNSIFYQNIKAQEEVNRQLEFEKLPIILKDDIMNNMALIKPIKYLINPEKFDVISKKTTGSTGKRLEITWELKDYKKSMLPLYYYRYKYYKILPQDRLCYFFTPKETDYEGGSVLISDLRLGISKSYFNKKNLKEIINLIIEFKPVWMILQPSIAYILADYIENNKIVMDKSFRYIELTGEMCSKSLRKYLNEVFNVKIANQYGAYEVNSIAYECPFGNMHVQNQNVYVEILNEDKVQLYGNEGEIVVTSLHNKVMPFIRYNLRDRGILCDSNCECKNTTPILKLTSGRSSDYIRFNDGYIINVYVIDSLIISIEEIMDIDILQYKLLHIDEYTFELHLVIKGNKHGFETVFKNGLTDSHLKKSDYTFIYHDVLYPMPGKKLNIYERIF